MLCLSLNGKVRQVCASLSKEQLNKEDGSLLRNCESYIVCLKIKQCTVLMRNLKHFNDVKP